MAVRRRVYNTIKTSDPVEITGDYGVLPKNSYIAIKGNFMVKHDGPGVNDLSAVSLMNSVVIKTTSVKEVSLENKGKASMGILIGGSMSATNGAQIASYDITPSGACNTHEFEYNNTQNAITSFQSFADDVLNQLKNWNYSVHLDSEGEWSGFGALEGSTIKYDSVVKVMPE